MDSRRKANFHTKQPSVLGVPPAVAQARAAQAQAQTMQQQVFLNMYVPMVIHLTQHRTAHGYPVEGGVGLTEPATPDRVADEAHGYVDAAMRRIFVQPQEGEEG